MTAPVIVERIDGLRAQVAAWKRAGERVALVPTMGALHEGHVSLVRLARSLADRVVVSIFVNPTQFLPHEDFAKYPRTFEADVARLASAGTDLVYHPDVGQMYPDGFVTKVLLAGPAVAGLEDQVRPTHFDGVAVVVAKLLIQAAPDVAIFGEKDFQQLAVIRRMALDLDLPVEIVGGPTVREPDGLALSSRNVYLSPVERATAPVLHQVLTASAAALKAGEASAKVLARGSAEISAAGFALDYLELRDAASLAPVGDLAKPARLLVAGRIGTTRLIDNIAV